MDNNRENVLVSICIPCYNHERFICDCFDSLICQTYENIELIICDDGSKDKSWEIIKDYESKLKERFSQIVLLEHEVNVGLPRTLNQLIPLCNGDYIKIIAGDDFLFPEYVEAMVNKLQNCKEIDVLFCNGISVKEESTYKNPLQRSIIYSKPVEIREDIEKKLFDNCFIFAPSVILRKEVYNECGLYNEEIAIEDWEYWLRIACSKKFRFGYLDKILVYYRKNENSMSSFVGSQADKRRIRMYNAEKQVIELYKDKMGKKIGAKKKIWHIIYAERIAYKFALANSLRQAEEDYLHFCDWKYLSIKDRIICKFRHYLRGVSKYI